MPGLLEQAVSRLHRTGQKAESINIYLFIALHTVAVTLRNNLVRKESEANKVVRDSKVLLSELMGSAPLPDLNTGWLDDPAPLSGQPDISSYVRLTKCKTQGGGR